MTAHREIACEMSLVKRISSEATTHEIRTTLHEQRNEVQ